MSFASVSFLLFFLVVLLLLLLVQRVLPFAETVFSVLKDMLPAPE